MNDKNGRGLLVQWYDSRLGCERSRVRFPGRPFFFFLFHCLPLLFMFEFFFIIAFITIKYKIIDILVSITHNYEHVVNNSFISFNFSSQNQYLRRTGCHKDFLIYVTFPISLFELLTPLLSESLKQLIKDFFFPRGLLVQWYDSRLGCERSRVRFPGRPFSFLQQRTKRCCKHSNYSHTFQIIWISSSLNNLATLRC